MGVKRNHIIMLVSVCKGSDWGGMCRGDMGGVSGSIVGGATMDTGKRNFKLKCDRDHG